MLGPNVRLFGVDRKRNLWRGLIAGLVVHFLTTIVLLALMYTVGVLVWNAFAVEKFTWTREPIHPDSHEWFFVQALSFLAVTASGAAIARWSTPRSWSGPVIYAGLLLCMVCLGPGPGTESLPRLLIWWIQLPLGVLVGAFIYRRSDIAVPT